MQEPTTPLRPAWALDLTDRQYQFVLEYMVDLNGTQAAIRAGYAEPSAAQEAYRLMRTPAIAGAVDRALAERPGVTRARIVDELARIAFANAEDFFEWGPDGVTVKPSTDLSSEQRSVVAEVSQTTTQHGGTIRLKLSDKQAALEKLGRALGMFRDRQELSGPDGGPIEHAELKSDTELTKALMAALLPGARGGTS